MKKYNLHIYPTFSDVEYSPEQIIDKLRENNKCANFLKKVLVKNPKMCNNNCVRKIK